MGRVGVSCRKRRTKERERTKRRKQCNICGHRFDKLGYHLSVAHSGGKHQCKICPCAFHHYSGLEHHIRFKHGKKSNEALPESSLTRPTMNQSKVSASALSIKAAISRLNFKPTRSSLSAKFKPEFVANGSRKSKRSSRGEAIRVICEDCGNIVWKNHLEKHLQSLHRGGKFACNYCPCSGFSVAALTNHKRQHYFNQRRPISTYLTQLVQQQQRNYVGGMNISSAGRSSSLEILDDQEVQEIHCSRECSCSPEIPTTVGYEGTSLDTSQIVSIEPDVSHETPAPIPVAVPINATVTSPQFVAQQSAQQQLFTLTSSSDAKTLDQVAEIPMRAAVSNKPLPLQAAVGGNSGPVPIQSIDINGNLQEKSVCAIRPGSAVQVPSAKSLFPTCHVCNTMYISPASLANHMKTHVAVCGYCGKTVPTLDIVAHMPDCSKAVRRSSTSSC